MKNKRIVLFGNNILSINISNFLLENNIYHKVIPENKDLVKRTGPVTFEKSFIDHCLTNYKTFYVGSINSFHKELVDFCPDILIGSRSFHKVQQKIIDIPAMGVLNFHYGMLPKYGGCHTIQHAILNGEEFVGVTCHFMLSEYDTGPIIIQKKIPITSDVPYLINIFGHNCITNLKSALDIYKEANSIAFDIFLEIINKDKLDSFPQDTNERLYYTNSSINFNIDKIINIEDHSKVDVIRHTMAFEFPPLQHAKIKWGNIIKEVLPKRLEKNTEHNDIVERILF